MESTQDKMKNLPCVILCGGKSSRMKRDKSLLPFVGFDTLTQYQLNKFENTNVYVSCKDKSKFDFEANFIEDKDEVSAPSSALLAAFKNLNSEYIFFISVDTPFFGKNELFILEQFLQQGYDAIVPTYKGKSEPLCAIYSHKSMLVLQKSHSNKDYKLKNFLEKINTKHVEFEDEKVFTNLNYYDEYIKISKDKGVK